MGEKLRILYQGWKHITIKCQAKLFPFFCTPKLPSSLFSVWTWKFGKILLEIDTLRSKSKKGPLTFYHSSNALQSVVCFDATINILILRKIDTKWRPGIAHSLCVNVKEYWLQLLKYCNCPKCFAIC